MINFIRGRFLAQSRKLTVRFQDNTLRFRKIGSPEGDRGPPQSSSFKILHFYRLKCLFDHLAMKLSDDRRGDFPI